MNIEAILDETFSAAEANDWAGFRAMFADDAVLYQNVGTEQTIEQAMVTLPLLTSNGTTLRYENVRRIVGAGGATELHDAVFTKPNGTEVRIDICVVVRCNDDGKIVRVDEYLDSAAAAALFAE